MKRETRMLRAAIILGMLTVTGGALRSQQLMPALVEPTSTGTGEPVIAPREAHVRITASVPTRVLRKERPLTGDYTVSARFRVTDGAVPGEYGLVVGGRAATAFACVARPEGTFTVRRGPITSTEGSAWARVDGSKAAAVTSSAEDDFTIRVAGGIATCIINGREVARVATAAGQLDGVPGIYVGPGSSVEVIGWRSQAVVPLVSVPADPRR
jgi:hypothetical protein